MPRVAAMPKPAVRRGGPGYKPPVRADLVPLAPEIVWEQAGRKSAYDDLLRRLLDAPATHGLRFAERRCRATVLARAKKLGLRILLAECGDNLWVKLVGLTKEAVQTAARPLPPAEACLQILREMPRTGTEVYDHMERLLPGCSRAASDAVLEKLRKDGLAVKKDDLKWYLTNNRKG